MEAFAVPLRTICHNAGYDAGEVIGQVQLADVPSAFDVEIGQCVPLEAFGIYDSTDVVKATIQNAIKTAALVLTVDSLVHRSNPEIVGDPS
jgi:chaperonin GroEL (HSP60 family)